MASHSLRVSIFSVGEGRAVLVQSPTGTNVLIDAGPDRTILRALSQRLGPLNRNLSLVIQTTPSDSALGGMPPVFNRYSPMVFMTSGARNNTLVSRLVAHAEGADTHLAHITARRGMRIHIGGGAVIEVLYSNKNNTLSHSKNATMVLRLAYGKTSFLFPSDVSSAVQRMLTTSVAPQLLSSNVLLVGHYGAPDSVDAGFLRKVHPSVAVISVGKNIYGYPATTTLAQLATSGVKVVSTSVRGAITFSSDGMRVQNSFEK
ncbi:MAG TPA: hypothetical protein ENI56_01360 [Candidatus Kaiserbacteria bacterium]|nr:hypothetical protein [Candidatus Kaiserbacteria bacterium]